MHKSLSLYYSCKLGKFCKFCVFIHVLCLIVLFKGNTLHLYSTSSTSGVNLILHVTFYQYPLTCHQTNQDDNREMNSTPQQWLLEPETKIDLFHSVQDDYWDLQQTASGFSFVSKQIGYFPLFVPEFRSDAEWLMQIFDD